MAESTSACDVGDVVGELRDVEALAVRFPAPAQIHRVDGQAQGDQLLRHPAVVAAVRVESGHDDDDAARTVGAAPRTVGNRQIRPAPWNVASSSIFRAD